MCEQLLLDLLLRCYDRPSSLRPLAHKARLPSPVTMCRPPRPTRASSRRHGASAIALGWRASAGLCALHPGNVKSHSFFLVQGTHVFASCKAAHSWAGLHCMATARASAAHCNSQPLKAPRCVWPDTSFRCWNIILVKVCLLLFLPCRAGLNLRLAAPACRATCGQCHPTPGAASVTKNDGGAATEASQPGFETVAGVGPISVSQSDSNNRRLL